MLQDEKIITLNLRSRPLRLAYLVADLDSLKDAVNLYTHTWGGAANALLPVSDDEGKTKQLRDSLIKFDPDYVLSTESKDLPLGVKQILESFPVRHYPIRQECIHKFVNGEDSIDFHVGNLSSSRRARLPHILPVLSSLYPGHVSDSGICILESLSSEFDLELSLQAGITSQSYCEGLVKHLDAKVLTAPQDIENLFKASFSLSTSVNPALLTLSNTKKQQIGEFFNSGWLDEPFALCLFLYEKGDLDVATSFWNARWFYPSNKILMPNQVVDNFEHYAKLALSAIPSLKAIHLTASISDRNEAESLYKNIKDIVSAVAGREIKVWLSYRSFYKEVRKVSVYTSSPKTSSQRAYSDGSVRFLPETPSGLETGEFVFGYDAELHYPGNNGLLLPRSSVISTLLSNSLSSVEYYEKEEIDLPSFSIRGTDVGIAGTAITGRECKLYIHPDAVIISRYIKSTVGIEIKPNRHTKYAQGFIQRLGGLEKVYSLVYKGGIETLLALCSKDSDQSGQDATSLANFLRDKVGIEHTKALNIIHERLPGLLACGLVRRGMSLKCPVCDLEAWYSISSLDEFIDCQGCLEKFQLENLKQYPFSYVPNQLSRRLIGNGGIAVLATASLFITAHPSGFIQFGGNLFEPNQNDNFAEIDLIVIAGEICVIAECKYFPKLDSEEHVAKALSPCDGLEKTIKVAERMGAKIVLLGVSTNLEKSDQIILQNLKEGVARLQVDAQAKGIGVYLFLTGSGIKQDRFTAINLENLILNDSRHQSEYASKRGVGELPCSYFAGTVEPFDEETLRTWKSQLLS